MAREDFKRRVGTARSFNNVIGSDVHMSASQWFSLVDDDPDAFYAPWFNAMGAVQVAVDMNHWDAQEGEMMPAQVQLLRKRLLQAVADLDQVAQDLYTADPSGAF